MRIDYNKAKRGHHNCNEVLARFDLMEPKESCVTPVHQYSASQHMLSANTLKRVFVFL